MKSVSLKIVLATLLVGSFCSAKDKSFEAPSMIYKNHCANCHGEKANGVPKLKEQTGMSAQDAAQMGASSQSKANIYGPPLNTYSKNELIAKIADLKHDDFDSTYHSSVMKKNITKIEQREGKITPEKMSDYISKTFGLAK